MVGRIRRSRHAPLLLVVALIAASLPVVGSVATAPAGAAGPVLDHFECYTAVAASTRAFPTTPRKLLLRNRFASGGFVAAPGAVQMHCNPARQTTRSGVAPITNPNAHLLCWAIAPKGLKLPPLVTVTNQFGTGALAPVAARSLCVPSWSAKSTPKFPAGSAPPNLDAYVCYSAVNPKGTPSFKPPSSVTLKDQIGTVNTRVGAPNRVCLATSKTMNPSAGWTKIVNAANFSVCFATSSPTRATPAIYDKTQFGTGAVKLARSTELCVPSLKAGVVTPTTTTTTPPTSSHWAPTAAAPISWYWQLSGTINTAEPAQVYDVDGFNTPASTVAALNSSGKKTICYIDFGTSENWRSDFGQFPASVQGSDNGWPGEKWLDIRQLSVLEPIMTARMQMCVQKGFAALEPDNIDGYSNSTGFPLSAQDQLTYNIWIANTAHRLGLSVGLKNDTDQTAQLEPYFDWALDEQCNEFSECNTMQPFTRANKAVFNAEYQSGSSFCAADVAARINGALYDLDLDGATYSPCTGAW